MKLTLALNDTDGPMWSMDMKWHDLPEVYAWEIASAALALASYVEHMIGNAADNEKSYTVALHVVTEGKEPKIPDGVKGVVTVDRLLYSQAVAIQDAGVKLLEKLQASAHMEIASGLRL